MSARHKVKEPIPRTRIIPCLCGACGGTLMIIPKCDYCDNVAIGLLGFEDEPQVCKEHREIANSQGIF